MGGRIHIGSTIDQECRDPQRPDERSLMKGCLYANPPRV
jgi:hypothetical protein